MTRADVPIYNPVTIAPKKKPSAALDNVLRKASCLALKKSKRESIHAIAKTTNRYSHSDVQVYAVPVIAQANTDKRRFNLR